MKYLFFTLLTLIPLNIYAVTEETQQIADVGAFIVTILFWIFMFIFVIIKVPKMVKKNELKKQQRKERAYAVLNASRNIDSSGRCCVNCGASNENNVSEYCSNCGTKL